MIAPHRQPRKCRRFFASDAGAVAIEFAFVIPVLLVGIFAVIEVGRIMYSKIEFDYAVYSATRTSAVYKMTDTAKVQQAVVDKLVFLQPANLNPVNYSVVTNADNTKTATISASYRIDSVLPLANWTSMTLTRNITFLINR